MKKLKWIAALVLGTCVAMWTGFAEGADYDALFAKARKYEEQGRYMYALGGYWDAMKADPKKAKDAYYAYAELANTIASGNPGYGEFDEFSIYDGWVELCKDFEKYWTENCPDAFTFSIRKGELDMATRTATYYVHILVERSVKFNDIASYIIHGFQSKWKNSWTGIPKSWPYTSIYKDEKNMMKNGVALFKETGDAASLASLHSMPSGSLYPTSNKTISSLFDVKFNVTDENGKVLLTSGRKRMGSSGGYEFKGVPQDVMKVIDSGKARIVPTGVWLEYGEVQGSYFDRSTYSIKYVSFDDNRDWLKSLPELAMDVKQIEFYLPGGVNSKDKKVVGNAEFYVNDTGIVNVGKFYMMATEVTWGQYAAISRNGIPKSQSNRMPMNNVSWQNAVKYCNLVSELQGLMPCYSVNGSTDIHDWGDFDTGEVVCDFNANGWRLPKADEWLYAAQGGKHKDKFKYSGSNNINEVAWYHDNSQYSDFRWRTHEVATKKPNSLGLYDMTGNVAEWVWESLKRNATDDMLDSSRKGTIGGDYYETAKNSELPSVGGHSPTYGEDGIGFRMVRNAEELPEEDTEVTNSKAEPETKPVTETTAEAESKSKAKEKKSKKDKKDKKSKNEEESSAESEANAQGEADSRESSGAESDESDDSESSDGTEKKSNIFTKAKDKAVEAKDKVKDGTHNIMDKMKSKKKDKNK
ncbi:MAG: formylglycine-generating enzyme family protein [Treponema sp.]|nr:formylglycine-generating enzyme family protein [Treponema sp.]